MTTKLTVLHPEQGMGAVIDLLIKKRISGAPVVDDQGHLVGVLSEGDCLKELIKGKYNNMPALNGMVQDHMTREVKTLSPDTAVIEAANQFLKMKIRRFPVVAHGRLLGMVSQSDVMKAASRLKSQDYS